MASRALTSAVLRELGETDCETLGNGWLAQPVNALSSLAYSLIGIAIVLSVLRSDRPRGDPIVYAGCLVAVGLGSVAFHGPQLSGSQLMHDLPILLTVLFMINHDLEHPPASRRSGACQVRRLGPCCGAARRDCSCSLSPR